MDELWYLPAGVLADRLRRRELAATEVLDAYLERVNKHNPPLNAVISVDVSRAREAAAAADRMLARGEDVGPLCGVPMAVKDGHDVAGLRTTIGSTVFDRTPSEDGTVAARLRAAGAVIVGHTNVPPFLADYKTDNQIFGRTNNPWDLDRFDERMLESFGEPSDDDEGDEQESSRRSPTSGQSGTASGRPVPCTHSAAPNGGSGIPRCSASRLADLLARQGRGM